MSITEAGEIDVHNATRQREVRLIRHGEKNPSTAVVDPNQLTEKGRRDALAYGSRFSGRISTLEIYCSTDAEGKAVDRSHDTGWYIHAGYAGLEYDAANVLFSSDSSERQQFVPGIEARLQQRVPQRILDEYKAKQITRAQAMEQCYNMLAPDAVVDPAERALMLEGAQSYLTALLYHLIERAPKPDARTHTLDLLSAAVYLTLKKEPSVQLHPPHTILLVGHDPNIGGLQRHLEPVAALAELAPLEGITFTRIPPLFMTYSFQAKGSIHNGKLAVSNEDYLNCSACSSTEVGYRRVL